MHTFSITYNPPKVEPKFTAPRMICVTNESLIPTDWKMVACAEWGQQVSSWEKG